MKLNQIQIDQIIEGLENPNTRLISFHESSNECKNEVTKLKITGNYMNIFTVGKNAILHTKATKNEFIEILQDHDKFTFELVTTNKDKSETRVKI
jgi:hypothetical protein